MHQLARYIRVNHIVVVFSSLLGVNSQSNSDEYGNRTLADRTHPDALALELNCGGDASACEMHQGGANSIFNCTICERPRSHPRIHPASRTQGRALPGRLAMAPNGKSSCTCAPRLRPSCLPCNFARIRCISRAPISPPRSCGHHAGVAGAGGSLADEGRPREEIANCAVLAHHECAESVSTTLLHPSLPLVILTMFPASLAPLAPHPRSAAAPARARAVQSASARETNLAPHGRAQGVCIVIPYLPRPSVVLRSMRNSRSPFSPPPPQS
jgi:hypothetical protein